MKSDQSKFTLCVFEGVTNSAGKRDGCLRIPAKITTSQCQGIYGLLKMSSAPACHKVRLTLTRMNNKTAGLRAIIPARLWMFSARSETTARGSGSRGKDIRCKIFSAL